AVLPGDGEDAPLFGEVSAGGSLGAPSLELGPLTGFASRRYAMNPEPSSGTWKLLTRSMRVTWPVDVSMMPMAFLGMSSGFFFSFFALAISALVGSTPKTTERLSAVKDGRTSRALAAMSSPTFGIESSGGGAGAR